MLVGCCSSCLAKLPDPVSGCCSLAGGIYPPAPLHMSGSADNSWKKKSSSSNNMERQHGGCLVPIGWQNGRTTSTGQVKQDSVFDDGGKQLRPAIIVFIINEMNTDTKTSEVPNHFFVMQRLLSDSNKYLWVSRDRGTISGYPQSDRSNKVNCLWW